MELISGSPSGLWLKLTYLRDPYLECWTPPKTHEFEILHKSQELGFCKSKRNVTRSLKLDYDWLETKMRTLNLPRTSDGVCVASIQWRFQVKADFATSHF